MKNKKGMVIPFPDADKRPRHIYDTNTCAGCKKIFFFDEVFTQVVMTSVDGMEKRHVALCNRCERIAEQQGAFNR